MKFIMIFSKVKLLMKLWQGHWNCWLWVLCEQNWPPVWHHWCKSNRTTEGCKPNHTVAMLLGMVNQCCSLWILTSIKPLVPSLRMLLLVRLMLLHCGFQDCIMHHEALTSIVPVCYHSRFFLLCTNFNTVYPFTPWECHMALLRYCTEIRRVQYGTVVVAMI